MSRVIRTEGVVFVLGNRSRGTAIPSEEIDSIKALLIHKIPYRNHTFLEIGQMVRIRGGALNGVEGILLEQKSETSLVISVNMIQRSLAMRVDGYEIEAI
jgi:transcription antitermination factor NusG